MSDGSTRRPTPAPDSSIPIPGSRCRRPLCRAAICVLGVLLLAGACTEGDAVLDRPTPLPSSPTASVTPTATVTPVPGRAELPSRDPIELALRLGRTEERAPRYLPVPQAPPTLGDRDEFTIVLLPPPALSRETPPTVTSVSATLRFISEHAYFYVQDRVDIPEEELAKGARVLEEVYPTVTEAFGQEWSPGVDGDPHIVLLHADLGGGAHGYFCPADEYLRSVSPLSNQREIVYLDHSIRPLGGDAYRSLLAHELQHLIHHHHDADEELWVNEGLSEMAAGLVGGAGSFQGAFLARPDTQLNAWEQPPGDLGHYGASNLFFLYLLQRFGGAEALRDLVRQEADGIAGVEAFLADRGAAADFLDVFADWLVATYLDEDEGIYGYREAETSVPPVASLEGPVEGAGTVHQFAADYLEIVLPRGDATFVFEGDLTVAAVPNQPRSGSGQWWSQRGDSIDTTLTREVDLSGLTSATLTFWTWFDIERWYDYGYVEVSTDDGDTWQILRGRHSSEEDPVRQAYGPAYTGRSGGGETAEWVEEFIDLTPFAGGRLLLRFEYVTDIGFNTPGWAIDDVAVPEAGFFDDAETDGDWEARGFARLTGPLPQRFILRVIELGQEMRVRDVPLDARNRAEVRLSGFGQSLERAVVVVAATTEGTTEPAGYRYRLVVLP